jgi:membrane-associated phospholipid phosphatase
MRRIFVILFATLTVTGCAHSAGNQWRWSDVGHAFKKAATSPLVLAPLAGALAFQVDDWDEDVADWASDHAPLYGSTRNARDASDLLRDASLITYGVMAAATPTGQDGRYSLKNKAWELGLGAAAIGITDAATSGLKDVTNRKRPTYDSKDSFPSGHTSRSAVSASLALHYVDYYPIRGWGRSIIRGALIAMPYATGWARVEGGAHFPSDIMAGVALGNFFGLFVNDLLDSRGQSQLAVSMIPLEDGAMVSIGRRY